MRPIHARYPFLEEAKAAVEAADVDLSELVQDPHSPVRRRARERIDEAISTGRVADPGRDPYVEVLAYPLARVIVSLVAQPALSARYAEAEAARAFDLFTEEFRDVGDLRSREGERLTVSRLLAEFDLDDRVWPVDTGYRIDVTAYLTLTTELRAGRWRLVTRALDDGDLPLTEIELFTLLREAVRQRVAQGLPLAVPEAISTPLDEEVDRIERALKDVVVPSGIDTVDPDAFPPCVIALLERVEAGRELPSHSRFALLSFLAGIGMTATEIADRLDQWIPAEELAYQFEHIHGDARTSAYPPPGCATMQAYGDCVNMDALCERIEHPLAYYARRLDENEERAVTPG